MDLVSSAANPTTACYPAEPTVELFEIPDDFDEELGRPLSRAESWARFVGADKNDLTSRNLLERFFVSWWDAEGCLRSAYYANNPAEVSRHYRTGLRNLRAMMAAVRVLDRHRHGFVQEIVVDYGGESKEADATAAVDSALAHSDSLVAQLAETVLEKLDDLAVRCRRDAEDLSATPLSELRRVIDGHRIGPDRRRWEVKYRDIAAHLAAQVLKFRDALERRNKPRRQIIRVTYTGERPSKKKRARAETNTAASPLPAEVA